MELAIELSQIATLRQVLELFCSRHDLKLFDRPAIIAARELMRFADEGENDPVVLEQRLDEAMQASPHHRPSAPRMTVSIGNPPASHR